MRWGARASVLARDMPASGTFEVRGSGAVSRSSFAWFGLSPVEGRAGITNRLIIPTTGVLKVVRNVLEKMWKRNAFALEKKACSTLGMF